jgi:hypothetical protein
MTDNPAKLRGLPHAASQVNNSSLEVYTLNLDSTNLGEPQHALRPHVDVKRSAETDAINSDFSGMTFAGKRSLIEMALCGRTLAGRRMGVYVEGGDGQHYRQFRQTWLLRLVGRLVDQFLTAPSGLADVYDFSAPFQGVLLEETAGEMFATPARR